MKEKILYFIKKPTSKNIIINTLGQYLNVFFTAFFAFLLVRIMTPVEYGTLSVIFGIIYVLANILDFGTTASIYSYLPTIFEKKSSHIFSYLKTIFFFQSVFVIFIMIVFLLSFPYLDKVFFKTNISLIELYITFFSIIFFIWQNFIFNVYNATKNFLKSNLYLNFANVIKTIFIVLLIFLGKVNIGLIIFSLGILGPLIVFLLVILEKKSKIIQILKSPVKKEEFRIKYTLTFFIASQFFNLGQRVDLFLLSYFLPKSPELGYYGLAQKIILTIIAAIVAVTQVLSPSYSKINNKKEVKKMVKQSLIYLSLPTILFLILSILPGWVFNLFFTEKYSSTTIITHLIALSYLIYPYSHIPLLFLLYTFKKPNKILIVNIIYFFIMTIGCYLTIPILKINGVIITIFISFLVIFVLGFFLALEEYQKLPSS